MSIREASLVTACMNRERHLRENLARWLALPFIRELIIVDWSNARPLLELAAIDERIRILRVVDEARWVLSYSFNLGISQASNEIIVKCDADSAPSRAIEECEPSATEFYAGHWRTGKAAGKPSINGQCVFSRTQFAKVNGYSEFMRVYGRDDEDLYSRLISAGYARCEIPSAAFEFIDHSGDDRLANQLAKQTGAVSGSYVDRFLERSPAFFEMQNLYIGEALPWGTRYPRADYETIDSSSRTQVLRRRRDLEIPLPPSIALQAREFATRRAAQRLLNIPDDAFARVDASASRELIAKWLSGQPQLLSALGGV
jgi:hypothetical protein